MTRLLVDLPGHPTEVHGIPGSAERLELDNLEVSLGGEPSQVGQTPPVDMDPPGAVTGAAQLEPQPGCRKRGEDVGGGPSHAPEQFRRFVDVVKDAQGDGNVVGIDFIDLLPTALLDLDQVRVPGGLRLRQSDHGLGRIDTGDMNTGTGERREKGPAPTADIQRSLSLEGDGLIDGETQPIEEGASAEGPGDGLASIESGEPLSPSVEIGLKLSLRHRCTPHFRNG
jgi:hypothetical protein